MPLVAVVAAIGADVIAGIGVGAVVAGEAAFSATVALEVVAAVGATIGAVGAVTGNKTLAMVGAGIGVVGAIGGLASAAGVFGSTAVTATGALQGATATGETLDAATGGAAAGAGSFAEGLTPATAGGTGAIDAGAFDASFGANAALPAGEATTTAASQALASGDSQDIINSWGQLGQDTSPDQVSAGATANTTTMQGTPQSIDTSIGKATATPTPTDLTSAVTQATPTPAPPTPTAPTGSFDTSFGSNPNLPPGEATTTPASQALAVAAPPDTEPTTLGSIGKDLLNWAKQPQVSLGLLQTGGSFLKGLTDTLSPAQVNAYNANAANNNAQAGLTNLQVANLSQPKATALPQVTGAPAPLTPPGTTPPGISATPQLGLINRPLVQPVTGSVAA
jgi:hypothetical protein